jgi:hypothetical protein
MLEPPPTKPHILLVRHRWEFAVYGEIFAAVQDSLEQAGARATMVASLADATERAKTDGVNAVLLLGTLLYFADWQSGLRTLRAVAPDVRVLYWHLEPVLSNNMQPVLWQGLRAKGAVDVARTRGFLNTRGANIAAVQWAYKRGLVHTVWADTSGRRDGLVRARIPAELLPLGHHWLWGDLDAPSLAVRDLDVLYLGGIGGLGERRQAILQQVQTALQTNGFRLHTVGDIGPDETWGEARNALVRRAKIYLCVYRQPGETSGARLVIGMANGAAVLSEPMGDSAPFVSGVHFEQADGNKLGQACVALLQNKAKREALASAGRSVLQQEYRLAHSAEQIVQLAAKR